MDPKEATRIVADLFRSSYSMLVRYAIRATGNLELAEDLVQEAFMLLYRDLRRGQTVDNPKAWTFCVIRRLIMKEVGAHRRTSALHEPMTVLDDLAAPDSQKIDAELDDVTKLFSVLTRREEEVTLLRMAALKYREIADQLGISQKSVSTLLARALRKLQKAANTKSSRSAVSDYSEYVATIHSKTLH